MFKSISHCFGFILFKKIIFIKCGYFKGFRYLINNLVNPNSDDKYQI